MAWLGLVRESNLEQPKGFVMQSESALRRRLSREGLRLCKIPERSKWYPRYGAYMIVNGNNVVVDYGLDLEGVAAQIA